MNEPQVPLFEPDEATLARDDALLDALGSGVRLPGEDTIAMALFMWREDLSAPTKAVAAEKARRKRRRITWSIGISLAAVLGAGAVATAAAYYAKPETPLFSFTERVFPKQASTASAQAAKERIADARTAVDEEHLPEATKLLDQAQKLIDKVIDLVQKQALIAELQRVRGLINTALGLPSLPGPAPTGVPLPTPAPGSGPGPSGAPAPGTTPTPGPSRSGGLLPLPLPTISLPPLPTLPLR